ncbi:hypothetical protein [Spiroplasma sp. BIUS-1]|uniref:hypothetical protein n=1 Tax=Spiroplasma sp. BIUS-1 TaxID=216964 RepID=UPI0013991785|nr:hypothetical protein [Spiroplasma sp. BIUS-1]QHX36658.1 hypothetical protein SBIUS_v1c04050 [Spiroplasma sp. BIUS-1]
MKINNIEVNLLPINPRYTNISDINIKEMDSNDKDFKKSNLEIAKELIRYEDNLQDMYELINSIITKGWQFLNDKILIHLDREKTNYYILEGNRRFLATLLIKKEILVDDIVVFTEKDFLVESDFKTYEKNIKEIKKSINKNRKVIELEEKFFEDVTDYSETEIWQIIYSKHIGEQVGKRDWSRAKYFQDIFNIYKSKKNTKDKDETINELSSLFGKKVSIIKRDLESAAWVINSIRIYELNSNKIVKLENLKVSGFELIRSHVIWVRGKKFTLGKFLGIKINLENLTYEYDEKFSEGQFSKIIIFLIENSILGKITTRGIDEDVYDEFSEVIGESVYNKKTLNSVYLKFKNLDKNKEKMNNEEKKLFELLKLMKMKDVNKEELIDQPFDSRYIKSIKYIMRNDLMAVSNLLMFDEDEYPLSNISLCIRIIIDMLILEILYRIKNINIFMNVKGIQYSDQEKQVINTFFANEHLKSDDLKIITALISKIVFKTGKTAFINSIFNEINNLYSLELKSLNLNLQDLFPLFSKILEFKINPKAKSLQNINLLNELVHRPYIGFEKVIKDLTIIDNFNDIFTTTLSFLKISKIWNK